VIELGVLVMLCAMGAADVYNASRTRPTEAEAARLAAEAKLRAEERRLLREQRYAARDEDERRRAARTPIGYRA
jgi:hypothetical protein